jgi:hypothetical protein
MENANAFKLHMEDAPAWYDIAPGNDGIVISVHPAEFAAMTALLKDRVSAADFGDELKVGPFIGFERPAWGFGSTAANGAADERGWPTIICAFPKTLHKGEFDWERLYAVSGTIQTVFAGLNLCGNETREQRRQCLSAQLFTERKMYGGGISARLSPSTAKWLKTIDGRVIQEINAIMARLGSALFGKSFAEPHEYNAYLRSDGAPIFNCPGNACDLGPCGDNYDDGCELEPHNTDSPMQQLTLLAGLAALNQAARKAGL